MRVVFGLLAIVALACLIAIQTPPRQRVSIGAPGEGHMAADFWPAESNEQGSYRWSNGDSRLRFFGYGEAAGLVVGLRLIGPYGTHGQETTMALRAGDRTLAEFVTPRVWRTYYVLVPPPGPGWQTPEIQLAGTLTSGLPSDHRQLGAALSAVRAQPILGTRPLAAAEYAAFAALLMALIWAGGAWLLPAAGDWKSPRQGAVRRASASADAAPARAGGRAASADAAPAGGRAATGPRGASSLALPALGTALAAGAGLLLWMRIDPAQASYVLPPLWGTTLLTGGALGALWLVGRLAPRLRGGRIWLAGGLAAGLAGGGLLWAQVAAPLGAALLLAGAVVAAAALAPSPPAPLPQGERGVGLLVMLVAGLAIGLRLYQIGGIPFGMWRDEARHGLEALRILGDPYYRPVYVPTADIPALLFYLQTVSVGLLGPTVAAVRVVPAIAGGLTALAIGGLAHTLWGRGAGVIAALLLTLSAWHIALSRLAFAAVLDPLLSLTSLALLWNVAEPEIGPRRRLLAGAGAGAALGLALYTYHPARLMPLAAVLWVALRLGLRRDAWRRALPALATCVLAAGVVAAPLLSYWLTDARDFNQRVGQVSLLGRADAQRALSVDLNENLTSYALMWNVAGDSNARHNIPGRPMLDPLSGLLFLLGLLLLAARRPPASLPLLALLGVGLLPGLLSFNPPHAVRSVDAIAPSLLIAAYAATQLAPALFRRPGAARAGLLVAAALVAAVNIGGYFGRVPYDQRVWEAFDSTADTVIGQAIQRGECQGQVWAPLEIADSDVTRYLAYGRSVTPFSSSEPPAAFPAGSCVFVPASMPEEQHARIAQAIGVGAPQVIARYPGGDQPVAWVYRLP